MSATLHIGATPDGESFTLPPEAVTETFAILAKRGVGKTYTASVLVEELMGAGLHVCVADPIGVWWGLRASADAKGPGLPIVVLGGDHGDVPLELAAGEQIADLVVEERVSVVLDLSRFRKGEQTRFMTDFAERLYHKNREPLHLILDEADAFAPQRPLPGQQRLLGAVEDLVRRGRARGIGVTLVTQRAAVLNKDVLTQAEVLIALRTIAPQDRDAIDAWIKVHGTPEQRDELMTSLPSLPIGTAWFWSPGWLDVFARVQVRTRKTFDSSATPKIGKQVTAPKQLAEVDLAHLHERLAATIERAKQDDPRELRKQIADLQKQLREQVAERRIERVEVPVLSDEQIAQIRKLLTGMTRLGAQLRSLTQDLSATLDLGEALALLAASPAATREPPPTRQVQPKHRPAPAPAPPREPPAGDLTRPQQRILDALAEFAAFGLHAVARHNLAIWSDQSPRSSGFTNNLGRLRTLGLIDYPEAGQVALTEAGRVRATPAAPITTIQQLHAAWYAKLPNPQARILRVLVERYPEPIDRVTLAEAAGQSLTSSGYTNNLGALRSLGLLDYPQPGWVVATDLLFPKESEESPS